MTEGQQALDDAIKRCNFLGKLLRKKSAKQVRAEEERDTIKATCLAWFNNQKPKIASQLDLFELDTATVIYNALLKASDRAGSRPQYHRSLKNLRTELINIRTKQMLAPVKAAPTGDAPPSFTTLIPDPKMQDILVRRWGECVTCLRAPAPMAATVMMGGLLEGLLLARINREANQQPIFTARGAPKDRKTGNPLPLKDWALKNYIDVAHELGWISESAKDVGVVLRDYRNYIHPQKELSHGIILKSDDAIVLWEIAKSVSKQLLK
jgi:hypothetical protein